MRALAAVLLLVPVTAAAQPAETREASLREEAVPVPEIEAARLHVSWRTDAALAETNTLGDDGHTALVMATAGAEVAVSHEGCDIAVAGGQISGTADGTPDTSPLAAEQWASLCPLSGLFTVVISHHLEWDVRPTLLAPPRLRPSVNRRETVSIDMTGITVQLNDPGPLALYHPPPENLIYIDTAFSVAVGWERDGLGPEQLSVDTDVSFFQYERHREDGGAPLVTRIIASQMDYAVGSTTGDPPVPDVMSATMDAVSFDGARVGGARVGGRFGVLMASVMGHEPMSPTPSVLALDAGASLEADVGRATVHVAADRGHWALWDGRLVLDDRLSAGVAGTAGRVRLRGEAFVARDHLLGVDGMTEAGTGGATAIVEGDLNRYTTARVRADGGRGFYATGAGLDDPRWGAEVLATLTMHAGTR